MFSPCLWEFSGFQKHTRWTYWLFWNDLRCGCVNMQCPECTFAFCLLKAGIGSNRPPSTSIVLKQVCILWVNIVICHVLLIIQGHIYLILRLVQGQTQIQIKRSGRIKLTELHTVQVRLIHNFRFDDLFDDILQGDDAHHFIERVSLTFTVHPLDHGQVGFTCRNSIFFKLLF